MRENGRLDGGVSEVFVGDDRNWSLSTAVGGYEMSQACEVLTIVFWWKRMFRVEAMYTLGICWESGSPGRGWVWCFPHGIGMGMGAGRYFRGIRNSHYDDRSISGRLHRTHIRACREYKIREKMRS